MGENTLKLGTYPDNKQGYILKIHYSDRFKELRIKPDSTGSVSLNSYVTPDTKKIELGFYDDNLNRTQYLSDHIYVLKEKETLKKGLDLLKAHYANSGFTKNEITDLLTTYIDEVYGGSIDLDDFEKF